MLVRKLLNLVSLIGACSLTILPAFAVDQKEIKIGDKWAVVGVIAGTDPKGHDIGIAVLRNTLTKHTYTLAIGDALPNEFGFTLKAVQNRNVVVANGEKLVTLGFAESSASATNPDEDTRDNRTARFIDNYYRGLSDAPIEIFKADRERGDDQAADVETSRDGLKLPLRRFGSYKEEAARSRFDLYRGDDRGDRDDGAIGGSYVDDFQGESDPVSAESYIEAPVYEQPAADVSRDFNE